MDEEFVPYELAVKLKALGFNEPCFGYYDGNHNFNYMFGGKPENFSYRKFPLGHSVGWTSAPTFSQAFRWFREKHNLFGKIYITNFGADEYSFNIYDLYEEEYKYENFIAASMSYAGTFETYEEAELACLEKLIEIV